MPLADFLGMNGDEWRDTLGLVIVFFVAFPLLLHGLIGLAAAQIMGERRENQALVHGEDSGSERS